jgi:predicted tellurium resistance membrane protein TerC
MFELFTSADAWISLATLTALEIILGIDNIVFLSLIADKLPPAKRPLARQIGLTLALGTRIAFLSAIAWIISLSNPIVTLWGMDFSWRDIIFGAGGLFLLTKSTREIHTMVEAEEGHHQTKHASMTTVIVQIALFDIVFSIDSVVTAVGMAEHLEVMIAAVVIAMIVMMLAANTVARFVEERPTVKMLALSFLLLIGMALIADALHFHIPRAYLYFAVAFSGGVELLNQLVARKRKRTREAAQPAKGPVD